MPATGTSAKSDERRRVVAVADRAVLRFLVHANCAAGEPLVGQAVRQCYAKQAGGGIR
ncbi:hypothetical protein SAMN05216188_12583 [Lentzea xinjiangensis]|uniref:Uncharacterized protein n=1 Tax=Lentzea xinjiangensis TaxID=402600 RepID=A0A1H9VAP6_9PSEU|nr:hypothetical protein [Lentzea xinjiangensis]SES18890.1 hypothetical protein SAMN05216188_12583 [Lentzea xinjiangensis]